MNYKKVLLLCIAAFCAPALYGANPTLTIQLDHTTPIDVTYLFFKNGKKIKDIKTIQGNSVVTLGEIKDLSDISFKTSGEWTGWGSTRAYINIDNVKTMSENKYDIIVIITGTVTGWNQPQITKARLAITAEDEALSPPSESDPLTLLNPSAAEYAKKKPNDFLTVAKMIFAIPTEKKTVPDSEAIKHTWKKLSAAWHPDKNKHPQADAVTQLINTHHDTLQQYYQKAWQDLTEEPEELSIDIQEVPDPIAMIYNKTDWPIEVNYTLSNDHYIQILEAMDSYIDLGSISTIQKISIQAYGPVWGKTNVKAYEVNIKDIKKTSSDKYNIAINVRLTPLKAWSVEITPADIETVVVDEIRLFKPTLTIAPPLDVFGDPLDDALIMFPSKKPNFTTIYYRAFNDTEGLFSNPRATALDKALRLFKLPKDRIPKKIELNDQETKAKTYKLKASAEKIKNRMLQLWSTANYPNDIWPEKMKNSQEIIPTIKTLIENSNTAIQKELDKLLAATELFTPEEASELE